MNESQLTHEQKEFMRERDRFYVASLSHTARAAHEKQVTAIKVGRMQEQVDDFKSRPYNYQRKVAEGVRSWPEATLLAWQQGSNERTVFFKDVRDSGKRGELVVIVHDPALKVLIEHEKQEVTLLNGSGEIDWGTAMPALRKRALEAGQTWVIAIPGGPRFGAARTTVEMRNDIDPAVARGSDRVFAILPFNGLLKTLKTPVGVA